MSRVLVVDDREDNLYYLSALLGAHGYEVVTAHHGVEALEQARQQAPDLVVADLLMPIMDGYTLLKEWKADATLQHIPFVVYTATYTEPEDERLAMRLGAAAFIVKPAEPDFIIQTLRDLPASEPGAAPAAAAAPTPASPRQEAVDLREYNHALVRRLEAKMTQLETANEALRREVVERTRLADERERLAAMEEAATEALRVSEERFRQLAENIEEVFWMTDPSKTTMIYVSPAYETIWGRSCQSLYASPRTWIDAIHPDDRERVAEAAARQAADVRQQPGAYDQIYRIVRPDGTIRWVRDRAFPVRDTSGAVHRIVGTALDITEQRQLEAQFQQAQKMETVGRLAGGIAHDFNNLLTVINGLASMALTRLPDGDALRADIEAIRLAGERGARMTNQLLAISRQQVMQAEVINLATVLNDTEGMLQRLIGEDIVLTVGAAADLGHIRVDRGQIEQVIMNLAVNARDAMPDGGTLHVEARNVDLDAHYAASHPGTQPGPHVMLAVSDTGTGMDEATRQRIFEPFFTTKAVGEGTGLGLSTVYGIVKQSGGSVWVYSEPGRGTTFKLYFPRVDEVPAPSPVVTRSSGQDGGTETILLVEDEPVVRSLARRILAGAGYTVLEAGNANDAVAAAATHEGALDLLLTDVVMPGGNGRMVAERIGQLRPGIRVLFTSGYTDDAILRHGVLEDASRFLSKPYTPLELRRKVREALDG